MSYVNLNRSSMTRLATIAAVSAGLFFASALTTEAEAGKGSKQHARAGQGQNGQWSRSTSTQRTPTGRMTNSTVTRGDGKTATRDTVVVNDRAAGTRSVDSTATGFNGRSTTYSSDAQRTATGYTQDVTRTLPNGQVNQHSVDVACDKAAQSCTRTVTGHNGG
jgi:hypothetical protein